MFDILIKNGKVIDGSGKKPAAKLDVAVQNGRIADLAVNIPESKAKTVIDAQNQIIAPGFIDIQNHSDSYWTLFDQPDQLSMLSQGITTIIVGNCGSSLAPLSSAESIKTIQKWHNLAGININWSTFAEFMHALEGKVGVNVGSLVGHATLRRGLMKDEVRAATSDEIIIMDKLLWHALDQGAFGLSMGLVYAHEVNSSLEELTEMAKNLKARSGYLSVHLRSEAGLILESLDEVITLAAKVQIPLKISHLKIREEKNWHLQDQVLAKIESAFQKGLDINFDVYPYSTSWSVLYTYLPKWAYEGGRDQILKMISSEFDRRKIIEFLKAQEYDYKNITIATSEGNPAFIGKSVSQIAQNSNVSNEEALLNILKACNTQAMAFDRNLSEDVMHKFLSSPLSIIATDGAGYSAKGVNLVHPRCYGAMPKFLAWVRANKKISWEEAIRKITGEPARKLGFTDRGLVAKSAVADLVVFDPNTVAEKATYENPYQLSTGINYVLVNGHLAYSDNRTLGLFGSLMRKM